MAPAPHKPPRQHKRRVSLFGWLAELCAGPAGRLRFSFSSSSLCCHQSRAVKPDCRWLCLFAYFHNDRSSFWMFSRCKLFTFPEQNPFIISDCIWTEPLLRNSASRIVSTSCVYCLKSSSSATLRSPELTVCDPLLQFYPSHLVLPLGFAWSW